MSIPEDTDKHKAFSKYLQLVKVIFDIHDSKEDQLNKIKMILDSGFDVNYQVPVDVSLSANKHYIHGKDTILHYAARKCIRSVVQLLLDRGADFICKNERGYTPLHEAFVGDYTHNNIDCLLSAHVKFNNPTNPKMDGEQYMGLSHFHIACQEGNSEVVKFFLENGVSANEAINTDSKRLPGCTGLHLAKNTDVIRVLLDYGADFSSLNTDGLTPLHLIIKNKMKHIKRKELSENRNYEGMLDIILAKTDDFNTIDHIGLTYFHVYCTKNFNVKRETIVKALNEGVNVNAPVNFDSPVWPGYTPLHFAVQCKFSLFDWLLENGANLLAKDASGTTPLDLMIKKYNISQVCQILRSLEAFKSIKFENGTNLINVLMMFHNNSITYLQNADLRTKIQSDSPLWSGYTLLHLSLILRKKNFIFTILEIYSKSIHMMDPDDVSPFHIACILSKDEIVEKFLSNGLNPNVPVSPHLVNFFKSVPKSLLIHVIKKVLPLVENSTALHLTVANKKEDVASLLLRHGADPFLLDADGFTFIHRLFLSGNCFISSLLNHPIIFRSNPVAPGGLTHFHIACYCNNSKAVKMLLPLVNNINEPINAELMNFTTHLPPGVCLGDTPLHLAIYFFPSSKKIFEFLIINGADMSVKNEKGCNPWHKLCCKLNALRRFKRMYKIALKTLFGLASKLEIEESWLNDARVTQLYLACATEDLDLMRTCLENGVDVNCRIKSDSEIWPDLTPLHILIVERSCCWIDEKVKLLIEFGASLSSVCDKNEVERFQQFYDDYPMLIKDVQGEKPDVHQTILSTYFRDYIRDDNPDVMQKLLKSGIDVNTPCFKTPCLMNDYSCKLKYIMTDTLLHAAARNGSIKVIEILLENGADVNFENKDGDTPAHLAALGYEECLIALLRASKLNIETTKNIFGKTVFENLLTNEYISSHVFFDLFKYGLNMDDLTFSTTLRLINEFATRFPEDVFESLIKCIPNLDVRDDNECNIIHRLAVSTIYDFQKLTRVIEILVDNGCQLDCQDVQGRTPLHQSVLVGSFDGTEALLWAGADINATDVYGQTPYAFCRAIHPQKRSLLKSVIGRLQATNLQLNPPYDAEYNSIIAIAFEQLSEMELIIIDGRFILRNIIKESAVRGFPMIRGRQAVLDNIDSDELHQKFPDWVPIFKLQRRRFLKRMEIFKSAVTSFTAFTNLPLICVETILSYLDNKDLETVERLLD